MALCAVGVVAFVADRLHSGDPVAGPSQAAASVAPRPAVHPLAAMSSPMEIPVDSGKLLSERLKAAGASGSWKIEDLRDAFSPTGQLQAKVSEQPRAEFKGQPRAEAFAHQHTLEAVLIGGDVRQAIIDGKCVKVGQKVEEFELKVVGEKSAELAAPGGARVTFVLPDKPETP